MALARHQFTVTDELGNVVPGAHIEVRREVPGQPLAALKSDREGSDDLSNPFDADENGFAAFHVIGGAYQIKAALGAFLQTERFVPIGTAAEFDVESLLIDVAASEIDNDSSVPGATVKDALDTLKTSADVAGVTHAATSKTAPVDADELPIADSAASFALKKLTWANLRAGLGVGAFGFHNRVINPSGQINQAGTGTAADVTYWFDQWVVLTQSNPITPSKLTNVENTTPSMMRYTQSNASAQRFGVIQPIESANILDARGQTVTLSARVRMSASTTLRYAIVEWTGTADSPTKDVVNDWTNGAFTPGNFFISTTTTIVATGSMALTANTLASISLSGAVSGSMNNLHVIFWTDSTQAQNVTLDIGKVQLEPSAFATPLALRSITEELALAQRYYQTFAHHCRFVPTTSGQNYNVTIFHKVTMRIAPTASASVGSGRNNVTSVTVDAASAETCRYNMISTTLNVDTYAIADVIVLNSRM